MKLVVSHGVGIAKARNVAEKAFASYKERYPVYAPTLAWKPGKNVAEVSLMAPMGAGKVTGTATIEEKTITYDMEIPPSLQFFQRLILDALEKETKEWVARA